MNAQSTPLSQLNGHLSAFPKEDPFYVHCAGGYRSMIAASILKARGFHNLFNIAGGYGAILERFKKRIWKLRSLFVRVH